MKCTSLPFAMQAVTGCKYNFLMSAMSDHYTSDGRLAYEFTREVRGNLVIEEAALR